MATLANLRAGSQALLAPFWRGFKIWQENYRSDPVRSPDGRYWQGLLWPQTLPDDGAVVEPTDEETDAAPQDAHVPIPWRRVIREVGNAQINKLLFWEDMHNALDKATPEKPQCVFSMQCDEYQTPHDGVGYTVTVSFSKGGRIYERTVGVGPLTEERAHGWEDRTPPENL